MRLNFDGAKLKVKRAHKHIGELEVWLRETVQLNLDDLLTEYHPEGWEDKSTNPGPIIGDVVHNLRCALDHCAYAICEDTADDPERIYFPLGDTRDGLITSRDFIAIQRAQPALAMIIADVVKPYKTGNSAFWALNQFDRMDKHRLLVPADYRTSFPAERITEEQEDNPPSIKDGTIFKIVLPDPDEKSRWTSSARAPRPGTKAYVENQRNGYLATEVLFREGGVLENEPIIPTLHQFADLVSETIGKLESAIV